jgi:hypothetical protein
MSKDEVEAAIAALEAWGRWEDNWILILVLVLQFV